MGAIIKLRAPAIQGHPKMAHSSLNLTLYGGSSPLARTALLSMTFHVHEPQMTRTWGTLDPSKVTVHRILMHQLLQEEKKKRTRGEKGK